MKADMQARLVDLQGNVAKLCAYKEFLQFQLNSNQKNEEKARYKADLYQKCSEVIKLWLEDSLQSNVDSIAELATSGLRHIIYDQELSFYIKQEAKYNRISIKFSLDDSGVEGDPMDNFGGGAILVISLIMRLAVMARMGMGNLLLLDESMSALANQYVPFAASFMRRLSEQTGVNILMVTHNDEFMNHAHLSYEGDKTTSLQLNRRHVG